MTTEVAMVTTYLLGAAAGAGYWTIAAGVAVVVALILGLKAEIHNVVRRLDHEELLATLQLLVLAVLIIPLFPNKEIFTIEGLNPRTIGVLTLLISAISYVGYFSVQLLGRRKGLMLTASLGALTSSTAVTMSYSRLARVNAQAAAELGAGVALACAVMVPRLLLIIFFIAPSLVAPLVIPLLPLILVPVIMSFWWLYKSEAAREEFSLTLKNPLAIGTAVSFALLLTLIVVLIPFVHRFLGETGIYALAILSGLGDVDALSLGVANNLLENSMRLEHAVVAIVICAVANTLFKASMVLVISKGRLNFVGAALIISALMTVAIILANIMLFPIGG
jgi:uncharacterized membrane protein (DUF4010 family)